MYYVGQKVRVHDKDGYDFKNRKAPDVGIVTEVLSFGLRVSFIEGSKAVFCYFINVSPVTERKEEWS